MVTFLILYPLSLVRKSTHQWFKKARRSLFFKNFFALVFEGYFNILLCAVLNLAANGHDKDNNLTNSVLSWTFLFIMLVFVPGSLMYIFAQSKDTLLEDKKFKRKWKKAYKDLRQNEKMDMFYRIWFILRRILFIAATFLLKEFSYFQLILFMFSNLFSIIYIGQYKPLKGRFENRINLLNEYMICTITFFSVIFSGMAKSEEQKYLFGWVVIFDLTLFFTLNMSIVFFILIKKLYILTLYLKKKLKLLKRAIMKKVNTYSSKT